MTYFEKLDAALKRTRVETEKQVRQNIKNGAKYLIAKNGDVVVVKSGRMDRFRYRQYICPIINNRSISFNISELKKGDNILEAV